MTEDFVTYEQAVLLKELGFDWKCNHYYHLYDELATLSVISEYENSNEFDKNWTAPTLSQAQKWLREVKQIDLFITKELSKYYWYIGEEFQIGNCDTYEEALSVGIDSALEQIKEK